MRTKEVINTGSVGLESRELHRRRLLRVLAPIGFVIVIFAALLSITAYSYFSNLRESLALSNELLRAIEQRIAKELETFLLPIEDALKLSEAVLENTSFDIGSGDLLEPLAFSVLTNLPQISMFNVADPRGNFFMVKKMSDESLHTKIVDRTSKDTRVTWIRRDPSGETLNVETTTDDSYDPRNRPWYMGAVETDGVFWTNFYVFFTDQTYGITVSTPIIGPDDGLIGVLGLDIELEKLNKFLGALRIGRSGKAIIVRQDGKVVAHPELDKLIVKEGETYRTIRIEEHTDPVLKRAYSRFQIEGHGYRKLKIDDRRYLTSAFSFPTKIGHDLTVFVLVPEEDFVGFLAQNSRNVLLMSVGVLVLTSLMAGLMVFQGLRADRSAQLVLARQKELEAQSNAFAELSSQAALFDPADPESLSQLSKIVSKSIGVRRTSVWQFDEDAGILQCIDCYDSESDDHTQGTILTAADMPELFKLLGESDYIRAPQAGDDDQLRSLYQIYLRPLGCESLLAVPISHQDATSGWLWFEHDRLSREWSSEEISFAHAIANMLALRFASATTAVPSSPASKEGSDAGKVALPQTGDTTAAACDCRRPAKSTSAKISNRRAAQMPATVPGQPAPPSKHRLTRQIDPEMIAAEFFTDTTVLLLRFTEPESLARRWSDTSVNVFDHLVRQLEDMVSSLGVEHMQVMGDEIVFAAGMSDAGRNHCRLMADLALGVQDLCIGIFEGLNLAMEFRIGIDTGAVMGSPVGKSRKIRNLWGDAVRFASMMAKTGIPGAIQVSEGTYRCIRSGYLFKARGKFYLPGIGEISTYLLTG